MTTSAETGLSQRRPLWRAYDRSFAFLVSALIIMLLMVGFWQVFARFVLSAPPTWSEELMIYTSEWMVFLGAAIGLRMRAHISVDILEHKLRGRVRASTRCLKPIATATFLLVLLWQGVYFAVAGLDQSTGSLGGTMFMPFLAVPAGAVLMLIELLRDCLQTRPTGMEGVRR